MLTIPYVSKLFDQGDFVLFRKSSKNTSTSTEKSDSIKKQVPLLASIDQNVSRIRTALHFSPDIIFHEFNYGKSGKNRGMVIFVSGLTNENSIQRNVLKPLMDSTSDNILQSQAGNTDVMSMAQNLLHTMNNHRITIMGELFDWLLSGSTILLIDGIAEALCINERKWESRGIDEPQTESTVRGSREGFTENIKVNTAMLRRKIKDPDLCIEKFTIGTKTKTLVYMTYMKNVADPKLPEEVRKRLKKIDIEAVLESGFIEQYIEDAPLSIFATVSNTEKPDKLAAKLLEGRVGILVDGSPFALAVPALFLSSFQSEEDYYSRPYFASFLRLLRFISYVISILAPAIYVALTVYHQELIPTQLLISIAASREQVPFPAVLEALIMIFVFDILREAGVRLPKPVGSAVSIVGALVLGQSAVEAGLISPIMVIVVSATAISSFVVPSQTDSGTILRYYYLISAGFAGGFGILMGLLITLIHMTTLRSFGTPYLSPILPFTPQGLKDTFIRAPLWAMPERPEPIAGKDSYKQAGGLRPKPPKGPKEGKKEKE